ncbi:MAG: NFACT RNA binding domain-containing protein [bacterium]|nr:NFACT RNA binding domain-containing protein [bacterium]
MSKGRGLTAAELAAAVAELNELCGAEVIDAKPITAAPAQNDLLVVLQPEAGKKQFLHVALGSTRARVCTTSRRFTKEQFGKGPAHDRLQALLVGTKLVGIDVKPGERRCELRFAALREFHERRLVVELFSARGLWALLDGDGVAVALSRAVETAVRTLRIGDSYRAPPPRRGDSGGGDGSPPAEPTPRFTAPVLPAIDELFSTQDGADAQLEEHAELLRHARRALGKTQAKTAGLATKLAATDATAELRLQADLMLAYAHSASRGATELHAFHPETGEPLTLPLDPSKPVPVQAEALYDKARRLDDGRAITEQRHAEAESLTTELGRIVDVLAAITPNTDDATERLAQCRDALAQHGVAPRPRQAAPPPGRTKAKAAAGAGENFRRFVSAEGYPILVGRNNRQNDRLTMRVANGNDLWLHVGGGRPGSHVVVKLPKQKTASLETLLDAAMLAVHFSKARGERRVDVVYCLKKFVKKPKGLPAGAVIPSQTKTVTVDEDADRLRRLLDSAAAE